MNRTALFAALGLALVAATAAPAKADQRVEGRWTLDLDATIAAAKTAGLPPADVAQMHQDLTPLAQGFVMTFTGKRLEVNAGPDTTKCDWTWGKNDFLTPSKCLDQNGKPNDLDAEREQIKLVSGQLHLINKPSNLVLILRRQ